MAINEGVSHFQKPPFGRRHFQQALRLRPKFLEFLAPELVADRDFILAAAAWLQWVPSKLGRKPYL